MFKCECCEKEFENYRKLNGHKRVHSDALYIRKIKPKDILKCKYCTNSFEKGKNTKGFFCSLKCDQKYRKSQTLYLVENGINTSTRRIKEYFILKYGNFCMDPECAWDHKKRPVDVELDHIDGNSKNNSLNNFRLLCPNCHSLTPTYKNKNKGNGRAGRLAQYHKHKVLKNK